jgi:hypothetical protein
MSDDFDDRLKSALRAFADAVPTGTEPGPTRASMRPRARASLPLGSLAAMSLVAMALVLVATHLNVTANPFGTGGSPQTMVAVSTSTPTWTPAATASPDTSRYADGIPRFWEGEPVLRGQEAMDEAQVSTDASSFLIALWAGYDGGIHSCPALGGGDNILYKCGWLGNVGDEPGVTSELGQLLRMDLSAYVPGPLIVRVHTHDKALMTCPASYASACEHVMVGEEVVWSGDAATAPSPTSLSKAAAAFGLRAEPSKMNVCMAGGFTGAPVLEFPATGGSVEGVVVVFPSLAALAAAAPDAAANGESDVPPTRHQACAMVTTDPLRGGQSVSLRVRWLARGNILVGVQYNQVTGADSDPFVLKAQTALSSLPER